MFKQRLERSQVAGQKNTATYGLIFERKMEINCFFPKKYNTRGVVGAGVGGRERVI